MEKGFFHPERGYWQATGAPSEAILATYPAGWVEIPLKPGEGYDWDGQAWVHLEPGPPNIEAYEAAIQHHVDQSARSRLFRDGVTLASYVASTNPRWAAEAQAFIAWRDIVWAYAYEQLAEVQSGNRAQPSIETIVDELPQISWPTMA